MLRMTPEPRTAPLLPAYGSRTLAELGSSILASLGGSGVNALGLPPSRKVCLLVVDGLGWELLGGPPGAPSPDRPANERPAAGRRFPGHHGDQPGLARYR